MSIIDFIEQAGEKLFSHPAAPAAPAPGAAAAQPDIATLDAAAGQAIATYIASQNLSAQGLEVTYDGATRTVTVAGVAPDQATKEKIVLCCGNVAAVSKVDDKLTVAAAATPAATYVTVKAGDTLSKIALSAYGNASAYKQIFDANKPMLADPDRIYPGQVLRIPPKAGT